MLSPKKKLINKIRSFLLLEQDKEINKIINSSNTRINGLTSKEFMEKNKIEYEISINNGTIYDCYKLPKNEEVECNILGKYCHKIKIDVKKFENIKENKIVLTKNKNIFFQKNNKNNENLIRKPNHINSVKENMNFLKKMSFCLKSPKKEKIKQRKSVGDINIKKKNRININLEFESSSDSESENIPSKKKATKNLSKYMMNLKLDKNILKNIYNKSFMSSDVIENFFKKNMFYDNIDIVQ